MRLLLVFASLATLLLTSCNGILGVPVVPVVENQSPPPNQTVTPVHHINKSAPATGEPKLIAGKYVVKSTQRGKMSWYSVKTNYGYATASGERLNENALTAAHKKLPMGTMVRVTNLRNGRSEIVRINDRGPYIKGRIIDVTIGTARKLNFVNAGVVPCKVEVLAKP